jgi:lipid-A-disaccharide synthase
MATRLFVSAGEASGDRHAAALVRALRERVGPLEVMGLGGEALEAEGARLLARVDALSLLGFAEVARRLPFFVGLLRRAEAAVRRFDPHVVIPVDYPGFNLRLARRARGQGARVAYYIAPQVWAWKRERRPGIARAVDRLLVVFPFEEPLFREAGISTTFVGHPLLDVRTEPEARAAVRARLGIDGDAPLLALLPGSRRQEVSHILPRLVAGVRPLQEEGVRVVVSRAPGLAADVFVPAANAGLPVAVLPAADVVRAADAALVASGTATLETGLTGTPLAVVYRTGRLNWHLARALVGIRTVGLVNIAAGGDRVPELLQDALTPSAIGATARRLLFDPAERAEQTAYLGTLKARLGGGGAAERAADAIVEMLAAREPAS